MTERGRHIDPGGGDAEWDGAYYRVRSRELEMYFLPDPDEPLDEVCNVDVEVHLTDGSRWSATLFTVAEVERLMGHWARTGEALGGRYFWCSDGLIVDKPGIPSMAEVIAGLLDSGEFRQVFGRLENPA